MTEVTIRDTETAAVAIEWCGAKFKEADWRLRLDHFDRYTFMFEKPSDALMFKLAWSEALSG